MHMYGLEEGRRDEQFFASLNFLNNWLYIINYQNEKIQYFKTKILFMGSYVLK